VDLPGPMVTASRATVLWGALSRWGLLWLRISLRELQPWALRSRITPLGPQDPTTPGTCQKARARHICRGATHGNAPAWAGPSTSTPSAETSSTSPAVVTGLQRTAAWDRSPGRGWTAEAVNTRPDQSLSLRSQRRC
jgi:hypothetical protein